MRRAPRLSLGLATIALTAIGASGVAEAQTTAPARYLNWAGRGDVAMPASTVADSPTTAAARRPNRVIPHGGAYEVAPPPPLTSEAPRRTLTPANAWLRAPAPAAEAPPPAQPPAARLAAVAPPPTRVPAPIQPLPDYLPEQGGRGQPVPAEVATATPQPASAAVDPVVDPMAPRRDAFIFRMRPPSSPAPTEAPPPQDQAQAAPASAATAEPRPVAVVAANPDDRPAQQGARYYSVHRQTGREPDAVSLPAPTYVDALAITTPVTIASQDLAQPDQAPTLIRDVQGRVRAQPAAPEGDYQ
ncbi:MAG: hypothetical protein ACK4UQ_02310 [Brevundimonas sp.]